MDIKTLNIFTNYVFKTILRPAAAMVCGAVSGLYYGHQKTVESLDLVTYHQQPPGAAQQLDI